MKQVYGGTDGAAYIEHDGVKWETPDAKLFRIQGDEVWIPKKCIEDENEEIVVIPGWLAKAKNLESDW